MSYTNDQSSLQDQLPLSIDFPDDDINFKDKLYNINQRTAAAVNTKISGLYSPQEKLTGSQYVDESNPQNNKNVYRYTLDFGSLPNSTTKSLPNPVSGWNSSYTLVEMFGAANNTNSGNAIPLSNDGISLSINSTSVTIVTTQDFSNFTQCKIIIEYLKS